MTKYQAYLRAFADAASGAAVSDLYVRDDLAAVALGVRDGLHARSSLARDHLGQSQLKSLFQTRAAVEAEIERLVGQAAPARAAWCEVCEAEPCDCRASRPA